MLRPMMDEPCVFCGIVAGTMDASIVHADEHTLAFVDLRQFHPGHVLVIPRRHLHDVRELDAETGAALMQTVSKIAAAVGRAFPNAGLSVWHSIGPAAFQEVPHLHFHVHPRLENDGFLQVYPLNPPTSDQRTLELYAASVRRELEPRP